MFVVRIWNLILKKAILFWVILYKIAKKEVWLSKVEYQKQENQHCTQSKVHTYSEQCYKYLYMWVCE